ncbi:MAG: thioredoxin family protein [Gammaproteobacteria bacterium]|nr:thioredoxin family protein [Gammaproteobacteria bacterium]
MSQTPSALLLIATGCQHCPSMLLSMSELIKEGKISQLEVVNIVEAPERAQALNVRSVPWLKVGEYELVGLKSKSEIQQWIDKSADTEDMSAYFEELMVSGEISKVQQLVEDKPQHMKTLLDIMASEESGLSARIGVGAIIEQLAGSEILQNNIDELGVYCQSPVARIRSDACYYLGLSHHKKAEKYIRPLLDDSDDEIKEIAQDALAEISENTE